VNSRHSGDFGPIRPGSGIGSHPMTERSLSHKSDGRHSSAGHSVHSGRTSSLGLDTNFIIGGQDDDSPLDTPDPPPGLFILGSVPSIIRCWLSTNFSHNALLYADICSGSQKSMLDYSLVKELGLAEQIQKDANGRHHIRLPVYLPEAVVTQPSSRSNSPAPQLPTLSADFELVGLSQRNNSDRKKGIRIFVGSDTLRSHNADIFFSQNLMTLYGTDRNKLSVPFVRPEEESLFKNLCTTHLPVETKELKATAAPFTPTEAKPKVEVAPQALASALSAKIDEAVKVVPEQDPRLESTIDSQSSLPQVSTADTTGLNGVSNDKSTTSTAAPDPEKQPHSAEPEPLQIDAKISSDSNHRDSPVGIWGSWRQNPVTTETPSADSIGGYQRAARSSRSMKVLKPSSSKSISSIAAPIRPPSAIRPAAVYEPPTSSETRRKSQVDNTPLKWESKRVSSEEVKRPPVVLNTIPRSENPVGGASAFSWMAQGGIVGTKKAGIVE
jgi:hypothetical protein